MRSVFLYLVLALIAAPSALADEAPPFKVKDVTAGDDERPEGWSPVIKAGVVPETAPTVKSLLALGKTAGLEDGSISARSRAIQKEDGTAGVVSVVGIDEKSDAFTAALADAAVKHSWKVRELASPMRVAVVWSNKADACDALLRWQAQLAVRKITEQAIAMSRTVRDMDGARGLIRHVGLALAIEPDAGIANSFHGNVLMRMGRQDDALAAFRKSIKQDAPAPATPYWQMTDAAKVGHILLLKGDKGLLDEAAKALERSVELGEHAKDPVEKFGPAYNLACAYSRLGRLDDAFRVLEKSLAIGKAEMGSQWPPNFEHAKVKDPDLEPLRGDPRFDELMKKYDPNPQPEKAEDEDGSDK